MSEQPPFKTVTLNNTTCRRCGRPTLHIDQDTTSGTWKQPRCLPTKGCSIEGITTQPSDPTNPKDAVGATKVPLSMFPAAGRIYGALAIADGAKKYGPANWRATKVRLTVYIDAMERHLAALRDGEDCAADSGIHHLGHVLAGAAIVMDALGCGTLIDDRPQAGPASKLLNQFTKERS